MVGRRFGSEASREPSDTVQPVANPWTFWQEFDARMRYEATRGGRDIGSITYLDGWLEPRLTADWRGVFDLDDIVTTEDRTKLEQLIDECEEIRPGRQDRYEDDAEEVVHRRGQHAFWFEAFTRRLMAHGYSLRRVPVDDDTYA
jgi:hypothetical protein